MNNATLRPLSGSLRWVRDLRPWLPGQWLIADRVRKWTDYDAAVEHPSLYLTLANLHVDASDEGLAKIVALAQQYGMLNNAVVEVDGRDTLAFADSARDWFSLIESTRECLSLLELLGKGHTRRLREAVEWEVRGVYIRHPAARRRIRVASASDIILPQLRKLGPRAAAIWALTDRINGGLKGRTSAGVIAEATDTQKFTFTFSSRGLAGAVFVQIALLASGRSPVRCLNCGDWFAPNRRTAKFCSTRRCRQDFHERKNQKGSHV